MTSASRVVPWLFAVVVIAGCATTEVTDRQMYTGGKLPRPDRIIVYDFATTRADLPAWSEAASRYGQQVDTPTTEAIDTGRQLGSTVAAAGLTSTPSIDGFTDAYTLFTVVAAVAAVVSLVLAPSIKPQKTGAPLADQAGVSPSRQ